MLRSATLLTVLVGGSLLTSCSSSSNLKVLAKGDATSIARSIANYDSGAFCPAPPSATLAQSSAKLPRDRHGMPRYSQRDRTRLVRATAFSCQENEPGAYGNLNAAGTQLRYTNGVRSAAADWSIYPVGTKFRIKGLPYTYVVDDYGSGLVGTETVDIYKPNLGLMKQWGTRQIEITVIQWGSFEQSAHMLSRRQQYPHCLQMYTSILRQHGSQVAMNTTR